MDETDANYNLAVEEYVLQQMGKEEFILLWQNRNAVVVGSTRTPSKRSTRILC
jgi:lipoate-protein ligase A